MSGPTHAELKKHTSTEVGKAAKAVTDHVEEKLTVLHDGLVQKQKAAHGATRNRIDGITRDIARFADGVADGFRKGEAKYDSLDAKLDGISRAVARSRWTPVFYLAVLVAGFWLGRLFG